MKLSTKIVIVYSEYEIEKIFIDMLMFYIQVFDNNNDYEILAKITTNNEEEYEILDNLLINLYYKYPNEKIIILNLLQDPQSAVFFEHFISHYLQQDFINKFLILSFGSTPLYDMNLFMGQYDVIQESMKEIIKFNENMYNLKEELIRVLPFFYANNLRIYWNSYISFKIFGELLYLPDVNNLTSILENLPGKHIYNDSVIGSVKMNEFYMLMRSYRVIKYNHYENKSLSQLDILNNREIVSFINYTSSPVVINNINNKKTNVIYIGLYIKNDGIFIFYYMK